MPKRGNKAPLPYYHPDHLGSINLITDHTGKQLELDEYTPFGSFSRKETMNHEPSTMNHYYTGQRLDSSTGLYYYGARYYDPQLGRFTQPDTIVQSPSDPQTLNRYTYVRNNPLIYTDPTGHSFWKKVKKFVHNWGNLISPIGRAIITGDWKSLGNTIVATAVAFVFSGFNPVVAAATMITNLALDTKAGWEATKWVGAEVFDDAFGMRPRTAYAWANVTLHVAGTLAAEHVIANALADPAAGSRPYKPGDIKGKPKGFDPYGRIPGGENVPGRVGFDPFDPGQTMTTLTNQSGDALAVVGKGKVQWGAFGKLLSEPSHTGASAANFPINGIVKLAPDSWYGTLFGTCHQATNATLLAGGVSNTVAEMSPSVSSFLSTALYGTYGGGLPRTAVYAGTASQREVE